jgi:hypothetical protein
MEDSGLEILGLRSRLRFYLSRVRTLTQSGLEGENMRAAPRSVAGLSLGVFGASRSESLRFKWVKNARLVPLLGNGWRCDAFPSVPQGATGSGPWSRTRPD